MIADILNLSIVNLLIHRNRKIASEMKCDSFYGFFQILLYQSSKVFYHIFFIIFIVIFTVKNIQYINVIMNNHIATGSQICKTDTENPPNKKPILKQQNNKNSYIKPKRSFNWRGNWHWLSVKVGMGNRGTEWGEWWECRESGWERGEPGWERGESRWECGESGWECRESGWFFVRIFVFLASAKIPERERSISPSSLYGQLPDY